MMRRGWILLLVFIAVFAQAAPTQVVRAFLDRTQVNLGDTVTLNLEADGPIAAPDLAPLTRDFQLLGSSSSTDVRVANGKATRTTQLGIALKPLHTGTLVIPPLAVGGTTTPALSVTVGAAPAGGAGKAGDPAFVEASLSSSAPYVGQQVVYTARLFYLPGIDGAWGDPQVDGARLLKLDRDHPSVIQRNGYTYDVIERSWAVIPERSGTLTIDGPAFQGQRLPGLGAWPGDPGNLLNGQIPGFGTPVRAAAPTLTLDARAMPAHAGQPWLPARDVQLKLDGLPANGKLEAGVPLTLTLAIAAVGQPADALPEPRLPPIAGAEVYPDQTRDATDDTSQWLQGSRGRSFAIVPRRNGTLTLPAITLDWWNVGTDRAEQATLPARTLEVSGAVAVAPTSSVPTGTPVAAHPVAAATSSPHTAEGAATWRIIALASLALWLLALAGFAVWWRRQARRGVGAARSDRAAAPSAGVPDADPRDLQAKVLAAAARGDAAACEHALLAWVHAVRPLLAHADLGAALADAAQRKAWTDLQRARWRDGDATAACAAVGRAFAHGFAWHVDLARQHVDDGALPPLYPS